MNSLTLKQHFYIVSISLKFISISATCANETIEIGRRRWTTLNILELLSNCKKNMKLIPGQWVLSTAPKAPVLLPESGRDDIEKTRLAASINRSIGTITIHHVLGDANFTHLHDLWTENYNHIANFQFSNLLQKIQEVIGFLDQCLRKFLNFV